MQGGIDPLVRFDERFNLNFAGAATTIAIGAAASATTWTGQSISFTGANTTNNTTLTVTNSSNGATANHSIVDIAVGGTTSTGDPQVRLTIPSGAATYFGIDNNSSPGDITYIGRGTAVGTTPFVQFDANNPVAGTTNYGLLVHGFGDYGLASASNAVGGITFAVRGTTVTFTGTTTVTNTWRNSVFWGPTLASDGIPSGLTVDKAATIEFTPPKKGANVTLTDSSAIRIVNIASASTNLAGIHIEALSGGATQNVQLQMANGGTEPTAAVANTTGIYSVDIGSATVLGVVAETAAVTTGDAAANRKLIIRYNGASYALLASTTLTAE